MDALHARWRETFAAGGIDLFTFQEKIGLKPDEATRDRFVKASSALSSPDLDEIKASRSADWDESKHPRDRDGKWTSGGGSVLSSKPMRGGDTVVELHREHGKASGKRQIRAKGGLSHAEMERLKPHLPKFLAEKMRVPSEQDANLDAMGAFELPNMDVPRIKGTLVTKTELSEARDVLRKIGVRLEVGTQNALLDTYGMVAAFVRGSRPAVIVRENPTVYELGHEMLHAIHWHDVKEETYASLSKYKKEAFVYNGMTTFFKSGVLNDEEIRHAKGYIKDVYNEPGSRTPPKK